MPLPDFDEAVRRFREWSKGGFSNEEVRNVILFNREGGDGNSSSSEGSVDKSYWLYDSGYTEESLSVDSQNNTTLNLPALQIDDADWQASVSVAPNPDVLKVFYGGEVSGLNRQTATALMNDPVRWGLGETLSKTSGESLNFASGPLILTGKQNIAAFEAHSNSTTFVPSLNIKFYRRVTV